VKVDYDVVEWQVLLTASRQAPDSPSLHGAVALNTSSPSSDAGVLARYFLASSWSPAGFNWEHWKDDQFETAMTQLADATDPDVISTAYQHAHERLVDDPPWLYIVHDLNPRAMSKRVKGFVPVQSWFLDLTAISLQ
jgi:ABC-type transport system substrate-binding protein